MIVFFIVWRVSSEDKALLAAFFAASITLAARVRWDLNNTAWYWPFILSIYAIHVIVLLKVSFILSIRPAIIYAPVAFVDFIFVTCALFAIERLIEKR